MCKLVCVIYQILPKVPTREGMNYTFAIGANKLNVLTESTVVFQVSTQKHLSKHDLLFWPTWVLSWDVNSIIFIVYRSCYIDPFKFGTWALAWEWVLV